jgi:hypothetical protein
MTLDLRPEQVPPEHRQAIFGSAETRKFVRISDGMLAMWDCTGKLAYVEE